MGAGGREDSSNDCVAENENGVEETGELGDDRSGSSVGSTETAILLSSRFVQIVNDSNSSAIKDETLPFKSYRQQIQKIIIQCNVDLI